MLGAWPHPDDDVSPSSPYVIMSLPMLQRVLSPPAKVLLFQRIDEIQSALNLYRLLLIKVCGPRDLTLAFFSISICCLFP